MSENCVVVGIDFQSVGGFGCPFVFPFASSKRDCVSAFVRFVTFLMIPLLPGKTTRMENEERACDHLVITRFAGWVLHMRDSFLQLRGSDPKVAASYSLPPYEPNSFLSTGGARTEEVPKVPGTAAT